MPEFLPPVANTGIQPDYLGSISKMIAAKSGMIGLQQQQQNLQTGAYQQQTAQAEAQGAQRTQAEQQAVSNLVKNAYASGRYKDDQGNFDNQKFANDVMQVAPTSGAQIANSAVTRAGEVYKNQQTLFNLEGSKRAAIAQGLSTLGSMDSPTHTDLINQVENIRQAYPNDPDISRMLTSMATAVPPDASGDAIKNYARQAALTANAPNASLTLPAVGANAAGQLQNVNQVTGTRTMPALGPGATNPTSPDVAGASARQQGSANIDIDRQSEVSKAVQGAAAGIPLTQQADRLVDMIDSGKAAQWLAEKKIAVGSNDPAAVARVELGKILAGIQNNAAAGAGASSVEKLQQLAAANPQSSYPTDAVHAAMDISRGTMRQSLERNNNLGSFTKIHGPTASGFAASDSALTGAHTPLAAEYNSIKDPASKAAFLRRQFPNDPNSAKEFIANVRGSYHAVSSGGQ